MSPPVYFVKNSLCLCVHWGALVPPGGRQTTPSRRRQPGFSSCTIRAPSALFLSPRASPLSALYLLNSVQPGCFTAGRGFNHQSLQAELSQAQSAGPCLCLCTGVRSVSARGPRSDNIKRSSSIYDIICEFKLKNRSNTGVKSRLFTGQHSKKVKSL